MNKKANIVLKKTIESEFEYLIANAKFKYIFLSYNDEGLMSFNTIRNIMSKYGKYECSTQSYKRFKSDKDENRNIVKNDTIEYIHCLIK